MRPGLPALDAFQAHVLLGDVEYLKNPAPHTPHSGSAVVLPLVLVPMLFLVTVVVRIMDRVHLYTLLIGAQLQSLVPHKSEQILSHSELRVVVIVVVV